VPDSQTHDPEVDRLDKDGELQKGETSGPHYTKPFFRSIPNFFLNQYDDRTEVS
jgi:hypothetical protein